MPALPTASLIALAAALVAVPAAAQQAALASAPSSAPADQADAAPDSAVAADSPGSGNEILVVAQRVKGQVDAPQPPIATYDEKEVAALGASSITDVLARIAPQTGSGRGRGSGPPAILVNGQRITNFREMRNYPPESIKRVEVLPEEVGLRFGFPPDARVVNLILKDNYSSKRVEFEYGGPTRGDWSTWQFEATALKLKGPQRFSVTATADDTTPLTEAERPVAQSVVRTVATDPDPAASRTLIADSRNLGLNLSWAKGLGKGGTGGQISLNGNVSRADSLSLSGLNVVQLTAPDGSSAIRTLPDPLERRSRTTTVQGGGGINTFLGLWQLTSTVDANHAETTTLIDRRADTAALVAAAAAGTLSITGPLPAVSDPGRDRATSKTDGVTSLTTLVGRPVRLPAGFVNTTFKAGYAWSAINSEDTRSGAGPVSLRRGDLSTGINVAVPLTSRREHFMPGLGDIALNFSAGYNHLSDFGSLTDWSAGLTWSPTERLGLQASYIVNEAAPTLTQLGSPRTLTFNVPIYDYTRGETVLATITGGGNPALLKERQRDWKLGANWQLPILSGSNLVVEYFHNRSSDVTASFPVLTPEIEAAFPGRVTRDASGRIVAVDQRPVTLAEQTGSRLRWGLNLSGALGKARPDAGGGFMGMGGPPRGAGGPPPGAGRSSRGSMMGMMMGGGGGQGRWNLGLYHTVQFTSQVLVAPGGAVLDLLNGDALTSGGTPRHSLEMNGGWFYRGFGMFLNGTWSAPTQVRASGAPGTSDLRFGSVTKLNANLFVDLSQQFKTSAFMKGARLSLRAENLFDSRQKVTDAKGAIPLSYQPDYMDPRGRVLQVEFRKMF